MSCFICIHNCCPRKGCSRTPTLGRSFTMTLLVQKPGRRRQAPRCRPMQSPGYLKVDFLIRANRWLYMCPRCSSALQSTRHWDGYRNSTLGSIELTVAPFSIPTDVQGGIAVSGFRIHRCLIASSTTLIGWYAATVRSWWSHSRLSARVLPRSGTEISLSRSKNWHDFNASIRTSNSCFR